uniref:Uncharacterized protein n=1 Tax=Arundo donax TaxID=35708 RepID=A0A0A8YZJ0_ARUDO
MVILELFNNAISKTFLYIMLVKNCHLVFCICCNRLL